MENYDKNIDSFNKLEPDFEWSQDDIWSRIEKKTTAKSETKTFKLNRSIWAVAASIIILLSIGLFMRFYSVDIQSMKGEQFSHELPDGSIIQLNAATSLSYHPYWWNFDRSIEFSGEAFFKVEKGKSFTVISEEAQTTVLGTSFNIYARENDYEVFCKTGKVRVESNKYDIKYLIHPGELAIIDNNKKSGSKRAIDERDFLAWTENKFSFTDTPLSQVFAEYERQYNIDIQFDDKIAALKFGAYFEKPSDAEQALDLIAMQFHLKFEKTGNKQFKVIVNR